MSAQFLGRGEPFYRWLEVLGCEADAPWCVVIARQGRELRVAAELAVAGWSTYVPVQTVWVGGGVRRRRMNAPLFARYLFAAPEGEAEIDAHREIRDLVSVRWCVDGHSVVNRGLMARLMVAEANHAFDETWEPPRVERRGWACGQAVKVRAGVVKGVDALIVKVLSEKRVIARYPLITMAGMGEATFETADLEPVDEVVVRKPLRAA